MPMTNRLLFFSCRPDFVMLNALDQTKACRAAMDSAAAWINRKNEEEEHRNRNNRSKCSV